MFLTDAHLYGMQNPYCNKELVFIEAKLRGLKTLISKERALLGLKPGQSSIEAIKDLLGPAKTEEIATMIDRFSSRLFGRHVLGSAQHQPRLRQPHISVWGPG